MTSQISNETKIFLHTPNLTLLPPKKSPFLNLFYSGSSPSEKKESTKWDIADPETQLKIIIGARKLNEAFSRLDSLAPKLTRTSWPLHIIGVGNNDILDRLDSFNERRVNLQQEILEQNSPITMEEFCHKLLPAPRLLRNIVYLQKEGQKLLDEIANATPLNDSPQGNSGFHYGMTRTEALKHINVLWSDVNNLQSKIKGKSPALEAALKNCERTLGEGVSRQPHIDVPLGKGSWMLSDLMSIDLETKELSRQIKIITATQQTE